MYSAKKKNQIPPPKKSYFWVIIHWLAFLFDCHTYTNRSLHVSFVFWIRQKKMYNIYILNFIFWTSFDLIIFYGNIKQLGFGTSSNITSRSLLRTSLLIIVTWNRIQVRKCPQYLLFVVKDNSRGTIKIPPWSKAVGVQHPSSIMVDVSIWGKYSRSGYNQQTNTPHIWSLFQIE